MLVNSSLRKLDGHARYTVYFPSSGRAFVFVLLLALMIDFSIILLRESLIDGPKSLLDSCASIPDRFIHFFFFNISCMQNFSMTN